MTQRILRFVDLFCGIGGFHLAAKTACDEQDIKPVCVFASDVDADAQKTYEANFGKLPHGDITKIHESDVPDHDILFAGFPY